MPGDRKRIRPDGIVVWGVERVDLNAFPFLSILAFRAGSLHDMNKYPGRLQHSTPGWVKEGELFHIRGRVGRDQKDRLTGSELASELLAAVRRYHVLGKWSCHLFLLMPDHWHALLVFPRDPGMVRTLRDWKRGTARFQGVNWQGNFFDHRIRHPHEAQEKWSYIRRNPVVKGLCKTEDEWPWWWSGVLAEQRKSAGSVLRSTRSTL